MYLKFYGFKVKPFNATPDPKFLFLTPGHREALAQLLYGVQEQKGFIVLTGEVGTGKTTLLHTLLQRLDPTTAVAFIVNSTLSFDDILAYMLRDFGIAINRAGSRGERLSTLYRFLTERCRAGHNTVIIFDEAQHLAPAILEQVRQLSNFETTTDKLLQIVLAGQPELKARLQLAELRQLRQRIGLRCAIPPLTVSQTREYIQRRLHIAGAPDLRIFNDAAIKRIGHYSGGIPRVVNMLCDHCLVTGYARQTRRIEVGIVNEAIAYLEEGDSAPKRRPWWRAAGWVLGAGGLAKAAR